MPVQFTYVPIASTTFTTAAATCNFSSIPQTYQDLFIVVSSRSTDASYMNAIKVYNVNADTGSNYTYTALFGDGGGVAAQRQTSVPFILFGGYTTTLTSGVYEVHTVNINNYKSTTQFKSFLGRRSSAGTTGYVAVAAGTWRNTAAITSLDVAQQIGNFAAGSTVTLYGIASA